ncbi:hypothetical protein RFI_20560 [Reticulomyxa filosa]|uniref:Caspase family p20 domain-containing protein n=1 Tax=Reticulomyxa filosa TaxID=46433 RepID=X6MUJ4_RETFI|nr:hypothetical protein RFI_20560 [Reticulomyxa filosa]|eukprot:ETO16780.1 hypothetical protein RFI_20560 [Reticulomyxa filosa]
MKELKIEELLFQSHHCLEWKHFQKMRDERLKIELINMKGNIIESDEVVKKNKINKKWIGSNDLPLVNMKTTRNGPILKMPKTLISIILSIYLDKDDVNEFLTALAFNHKLHKNKNQYDALIIIISGHGVMKEMY